MMQHHRGSAWAHDGGVSGVLETRMAEFQLQAEEHWYEGGHSFKHTRAIDVVQVHTFDPFLSTDTQANVQGRPGLKFHAVGVLGSADGRVGSEGPEKWQSLESIMLDLQHEWLEVLLL